MIYLYALLGLAGIAIAVFYFLGWLLADRDSRESLFYGCLVILGIALCIFGWIQFGRTL